MWFISHHEIEQRLVYDGMRVVIVDEFSVGDLVCPGTRVGPAEDPEVCLDLLVNTFCLTVRLEVVGGGEGEIIVEELSEFLGEGRGELWTLVRDDFIVKSEV